LLVIVGALVATALVTPAGAHVGGSVKHAWKKHFAPLAQKMFYTKSKSDGRYLKKTDAAATYVKKADASTQLWAVVDYSGDPTYAPYIDRAKGAIGVAASDVNATPGDATDDAAVVTFNRDVSNCVASLTPMNQDLNAVFQGIVSTFSAGTQITVQLGSSTGTDTTGPFSLLVTC
jgi:hypothetical protein